MFSVALIRAPLLFFASMAATVAIATMPAAAAPAVPCDFDNDADPTCGFTFYGHAERGTAPFQPAYSGAHSIFNGTNEPINLLFNQVVDVNNMRMLSWAGFPAARVDVSGFLGGAFLGTQSIDLTPAWSWMRVDFGSIFNAVDQLYFAPFTATLSNFGTFAIDDLNLAPPPEPPPPSPITLIEFEGGDQFEPVALPFDEPIGRITDTIGEGDLADFYTFDWAGGAFRARATVSDAHPDAAFDFQLLDLDLNVISSVVLDTASGFTGLIDTTLSAGNYHVGLLALENFDPPFHIDFETPVFGPSPTNTAGVPAPNSLALLGLGLIAAAASTGVAAGSRSVIPR